MAKIVTLRKRPEFLRLRGGDRWANASFVLETKPALTDRPEPRDGNAGRTKDGNAGRTKTARAGAAIGATDCGGVAQVDIVATGEASHSAPPRFGFTVTRQIGNAVVRNRIRRRLKAIVTDLAPKHARPGHDYVIIVRQGAIDRPFADLAKDLEQALQRVHHPRPTRRRKS